VQYAVLIIFQSCIRFSFDGAALFVCGLYVDLCHFLVPNPSVIHPTLPGFFLADHHPPTYLSIHAPSTSRILFRFLVSVYCFSEFSYAHATTVSLRLWLFILDLNVLVLPASTMSSMIDVPYFRASTALENDQRLSLSFFADYSRYYVAFGLIILGIWFSQGKKPNNLAAPFFKASRLRWMFDAESLVRESYSKVSKAVAETLCCTRHRG
jgi:hypothetical protein